ncbi:protein piccolo [Pelomyxa schiedti]|nr:protein piccolo [Pelomyxa schiedti]
MTNAPETNVADTIADLLIEVNTENVTISSALALSSIKASNKATASKPRTQSSESVTPVPSSPVLPAQTSETSSPRIHTLTLDTPKITEPPDIPPPPLSEEELQEIEQKRLEDAKHRKRVLDELLTTEKSYMKGLLIACRVYAVAMKAPTSGCGRYIPRIFSNLEEVLTVSKRLLVKMTVRIKNWKPTSCIGDVLLNALPEFECYKTYLGNHHVAINTMAKLTKKNEKYVAIAGVNRDSEGKDLAAYLITPVQRIPRYLLLLKDYLKHLPLDHPDYSTTSNVVDQFAKLAELVNSSIKKQENFKKVNEVARSFVNVSKEIKTMIKSDHLFMREGQLTKVCRKTTKKRNFWLFSDCLIYGEKVGGGENFLLHRVINLRKGRVVSLQDSADVKNGFAIISGDKSFTVMAETLQERNFWVLDLNEILTGVRKTGDTCALVFGSSGGEEAPLWVPDKETPCCMLCKDQFTMLKRRHHCRNCGRVVCGNCSSQKKVLAHIEKAKALRVCTSCFEGDTTEKSASSKSPKAPPDDNGEELLPTSSLDAPTDAELTAALNDVPDENPEVPTTTTSTTPTAESRYTTTNNNSTRHSTTHPLTAPATQSHHTKYRSTHST